MKRTLRRDLLRWFDSEKRDLPWRRTRDAYAIWLSEVMLQQTQVATVIPYWRRFLDRFPDVGALAAAPLPDVLALWRGLGYYSRARNLHRAAQEIVARHQGELPASADALRELPGFGRYTAGAVASIAFGAPAPLVDGNVARVLSRLFEVEGAPGDRAREAKLWELAEALVGGERPGDWNQALMELGALICKPTSPSCLLCPVREHCGALAHGRVDELPPPRQRAAPKMLELGVAVCTRGNRVLLGRRAESGLFGGLWELPTAPFAPSPAALAKSFGRASGLSIEIGEPVGTVRRALTHRKLVLHLHRAQLRVKPRPTPAYPELRWTTAKDAESLGMSTAMDRALALAFA